MGMSLPSLLNWLRTIGRRVRAEWIEWWRAFLRGVPGGIGCFLRRNWFGVRCGRGTYILSHAIIYHPERVSLGMKVRITCFCQLNGGGGIEIGDNVLIGPGVMIWSQNHRYQRADIPITDQGYDYAKVTIEEDVWIGARSIILPGVHISKGAVVAAGSVVTRSVAPYTVVAGVPARPIKSRTSSSTANLPEILHSGDQIDP